MWRLGDKPLRLNVGDRIKFAEERLAYTVQACNFRYAICTKPFNPMKTVLYTILDLKQGIRGPENLIFGFGAETREDCVRMLCRLRDDHDPTEVSHRHRIPLDIEKVLPCR